MTTNTYIQRVCSAAFQGCGSVYTQTLQSAFAGLDALSAEFPAFEKSAVLERLSHPERLTSFFFVWQDDNGRSRLSRGYHVCYCSALGIGQTTVCFAPDMTADEIGARAFLKTLESVLAGAVPSELCGADCDPAALSAGESSRFCLSFAAALHRHHLPFPATALLPSVYARESGFLRGASRALHPRPMPPAPQKRPLTPAQADGYGLCHFAQRVLRKSTGSGFSGKSVSIAGGSEAAAYAAEKAFQLGAQVIAVSGGKGIAYEPDGLSLAQIRQLSGEIAAHPVTDIQYYSDPAGLWKTPADIWLLCHPHCLDQDAARMLAQTHPLGVFAGVVDACDPAQASVLQQNHILFSPGIASGAGNVAYSATEEVCTAWEADRHLQAAMEAICAALAAEDGGCLADCAYVAAFRRLGNALLENGLV